MIRIMGILASACFGLALGAGAGVAQAAELTSAETAPLAAPVTLKVGFLRSASLGNLMVAKQLGFFEAENLNVELEPVANSQEALVLLSQGRMDALTGSLSAGMLNAVASGLEVRVVSGISTNAAVEGVDTPSPSGLYVRKEAADQIKSYADLKGRLVGSVGTIGTAVSYLIGLYAEKGGLTLKDVELQSFTLPDALVALKSGRVDVAYLTAPFSVEAVEQGIAVEFGDAREIYGHETQSALMFGPNLLVQNRQAGAAFMRAMVKATDRFEGDYRNDEQIAQAISTWTGASVDAVKRIPPYRMTLTFDPATLANMQRMFLAHGNVLSYAEPLTAEQVVDPAFLDAARK